MELPPALAPWADFLDVFPLETLIAVGPLIQRLHSAIGPLQIATSSPTGEPDGYDGLTRRGVYDRLVVSEWAFAEVAPDEFIRRAAMREHLFLNPARIEAAGAKRSIALFDVGPSQLGSPRLAHLAILIVLARRAKQAGISFYWETAQKRDFSLQCGVQQTTVSALLKARSLHEPTSEESDSFFNQTPAKKAEKNDVWLIGGARMCEIAKARNLSCIQIEDVLLPGIRELEAVIRHSERTERRLSLTLPDDRTVTQIIRDISLVPSAKPRVSRPQFAPASNLVFAPGGVKLFACNRNGQIVSYPIPNSPHAGYGKPKIHSFSSSASVVAVTRIRKSLLAVLRDERGLIVETCPLNAPHFGYVGRYDFDGKLRQFGTNEPSETRSLNRIFPCVLGTERNEFLFTFGGECYVLQNEKNVRTTINVGAFIPSVAQFRDRIVWLRTDGANGSPGADSEKEWKIESVNCTLNFENWQKNKEVRNGRSRPGLDPFVSVFFGFPCYQGDKDFGLLAIRQDECEWKVINQNGERIFRIPDSMEVVGVVEGPPKWNPTGTALVTLEADRRIISLMGLNWSKSLPRASSAIKFVSVSETEPYIAYATEGGEVVVYSLYYDAILYRLVTAE